MSGNVTEEDRVHVLLYQCEQMSEIVYYIKERQIITEMK